MYNVMWGEYGASLEQTNRKFTAYFHIFSVRDAVHVPCNITGNIWRIVTCTSVALPSWQVR